MRMPFGRYRGSLLEDLAQPYLEWLCSLDNLREPLRSAVEAEQERRAEQSRDDFCQSPDFQINGSDRKIARQIIESGRRSLAKVQHPDHGGELATMQRVNVVADAMLESLR